MKLIFKNFSGLNQCSKDLQAANCTFWCPKAAILASFFSACRVSTEKLSGNFPCYQCCIPLTKWLNDDYNKSKIVARNIRNRVTAYFSSKAE